MALAVLLVLSLLGLPARLSEPWPWLFELGLIALGGWLVLHAARRALGTQVPAASWPLRVAVALLIAISIGQLARTKKAFPWMPYTMYGRAREGDVVFYRFSARHASGGHEPFRPTRELTTLGNGRLGKGLHAKLDEITALRASGRSAEAEERLLRQVISALVARERRGLREDAIVAIDVQRVVLAPPFDPEAIRSESVLTLALGPAP